MDISLAPTADPQPKARPRAIARWLYGVAALILLMVVVGGITRLTESGLSITSWKPVTGAIPPLNDAAWQAEFDAYRNSGQYRLMNAGMTLAAFKHIYFWEYVHRLLGRLIGIAYAVPMLWFLLRGAVPRGYGPRLVLLLFLGGLQGAVGWLMVRSGLVDRVNVEPTMLAAHLGMALLLLGAIVWTARDMALAHEGFVRTARLTLLGATALILLFGQILLGALTAGLRAGYVANTWPLMNDRFVPDGMLWWGTLWLTLTSDPFLVHFLHRWWAWVAAIALVLIARRISARGGGRLGLAIAGLVTVQIVLGVATVLTGVSLPIAIAHQLTGAVLLAYAVAGVHFLGRSAA